MIEKPSKFILDKTKSTKEYLVFCSDEDHLECQKIILEKTKQRKIIFSYKKQQATLKTPSGFRIYSNVSLLEKMVDNFFQKAASLSTFSVINEAKRTFFYQGKEFPYQFNKNLLMINEPFPHVVKAASEELLLAKLKLYLKRRLRKRLLILQPFLENEMQIEKHAIEIRDKYRQLASNHVLKKKIIYSLNAVGFSDEMLKGLIAHELCHQIAYNHGEEFKACILQKYPAYNLYKKALKRLDFTFKIQ